MPFNGKLIVTNGTNSNWGLVNHPKINKAMEAAEKVVGTQARANAWAKIDNELVAEAVAVALRLGQAAQHRVKERRRRR